MKEEWVDKIRDIEPILTKKELEEGVIIIYCPYCDDATKHKPLKGESPVGRRFVCQNCEFAQAFTRKILPFGK